MTINPTWLFALALTTLSVSHAQVIFDSEAKTEGLDISSGPLKLARQLGPDPGLPESLQPDVPGRIIDRAGQVIKLLDTATTIPNYESSPRCQSDALARATALCGLRWRKADAFTNLKSRYEGFNRGVKSGLFGKALAEHVELDLDTSPEIRFEYRFD